MVNRMLSWRPPSLSLSSLLLLLLMHIPGSSVSPSSRVNLVTAWCAASTQLHSSVLPSSTMRVSILLWVVPWTLWISE